MAVSIVGLLAVPFVGTRWGDFDEMIALIIGVAPLIYLLFFALANLNQRIAELEDRRLGCVSNARRSPSCHRPA